MVQQGGAFRASSEERVGRTLCQKYTLEKVLGEGGMASVYLGRHRNGHRVAVKVLHPQCSASPEIRRRFLREGYVANKVEHPGVVRVLDDDVAEDGSAFLVMELLEGQTLEGMIEDAGNTLSPRDLVPIVRQLLEVLVAAHEKGIVHRDLKPENLFIQRGIGVVKVLDFGIARLNESEQPQTRTGHLMGTPVYMAPEQARGEKHAIDGQTDLWSVGAILFRGLTGRYVYDATTPEMAMIMAATQPARRIGGLLPTIDPELARVVDQALASSKAQRWPTAAAFLEALSRIPLERLSPLRAGQLPETIDMTRPLPRPTPPGPVVVVSTTPGGLSPLEVMGQTDPLVASPLRPGGLAAASTTAGVARGPAPSAPPAVSRRGLALLLAGGGLAVLLGLGGVGIGMQLRKPSSPRLEPPSSLSLAPPAPPGSATASGDPPSGRPQLGAPVVEPTGQGTPASLDAGPTLGNASPAVAPPRPQVTALRPAAPSATKTAVEPAATASVPPPAPPPPNCKPPYVVTPSGDIKWKPECAR